MPAPHGAALRYDNDWDDFVAVIGRSGGLGTATSPGSQRAIIVVTVDGIADSCGYAVPIMELTGERDVLLRWAERKSADELAEYRLKHNGVSIDGLPALGSS